VCASRAACGAGALPVATAAVPRAVGALRAATGTVVLALLLCLVPAGSGHAAQTAQQPASTATAQTLPSGLVRPASLDRRPAGRALTSRAVLQIADARPVVRAERRRAPGSTREAYLKGSDRWQVSFYDDRGPERREIAQVILDDATGSVLEEWVGYEVAWTMARGYPGAFGRRVNSPWVWIPLAVAFVVPFVDPRRPWLALHVDLLVLSAFSVALACFNASAIEVSTPLVVPLLAYLVARMLWIGLRRRGAAEQAREPLRLLVPVRWLAVAVVFLIGFRVGLNIVSSNVIDVGYSGVIGADKLADGERLYGAFPRDNEHGDTYGPVTYAAYVPFEQALPWSGRWDDLPAAHGAALTFDLLVVALLFLLGRRIRGPGLGVVLAYAWVAYPFTLYVSNSNANDALVAAGLVGTLLVAASPPARGALLALVGLTKFGPLALAPLFALHAERDPRPGDGGSPRARPPRRAVLAFALAFLAVLAVAAVPVLLHGGTPRAFWDATLGFQTDRESPFSIWTLWDALDGWEVVVQGAAVALALAVAVLPRRRDAVGLAALAAAVLLALQLGLTYWFFLYLAWTFPLVMVALLGRHGEPEAGSARWRRRAGAPSSAPAPP